MFYKERIDFFAYFKTRYKDFSYNTAKYTIILILFENKNELYINTARYYMIFISLSLKYNFYIKLIHFNKVIILHN